MNRYLQTMLDEHRMATVLDLVNETSEPPAPEHAAAVAARLENMIDDFVRKQAPDPSDEEWDFAEEAFAGFVLGVMMTLLVEMAPPIAYVVRDTDGLYALKVHTPDQMKRLDALPEGAEVAVYTGLAEPSIPLAVVRDALDAERRAAVGAISSRAVDLLHARIAAAIPAEQRPLLNPTKPSTL